MKDRTSRPHPAAPTQQPAGKLDFSDLPMQTSLTHEQYIITTTSVATALATHNRISRTMRNQNMKKLMIIITPKSNRSSTLRTKKRRLTMSRIMNGNGSSNSNNRYNNRLSGSS